MQTQRRASLASPAPAVQQDTSAATTRRCKKAAASFSDLRALNSGNGNGNNNSGDGDGDAGGRGGRNGGGGGGGGASSSGGGRAKSPWRRNSESGKLNLAGQRFVVVAKFPSVHHFIRDTNEVFSRVRWESSPSKPSPSIPIAAAADKRSGSGAPRRRYSADVDRHHSEDPAGESPSSAIQNDASHRIHQEHWSPQTSPRAMVRGC
jgi:hypothetical protein